MCNKSHANKNIPKKIALLFVIFNFSATHGKNFKKHKKKVSRELNLLLFCVCF